MKKILVLLAFVMLCLAGTSWGAGSCTFVSSKDGTSSIELSWECTSDGSGNVSAPTITGTGYNTAYTGRIDRVRIIPGTSADQPTASYVVRLRPGADNTIDLLYDVGSACSDTNTVAETPLTATNKYPVKVFGETLTPYASGVGAANKFTLKVLLVK